MGFHFHGLCQGLPSVFNLRNVVHSLRLEEERKEFSRRSDFNQGGLFSISESQHPVLLEFKIKCYRVS